MRTRHGGQLSHAAQRIFTRIGWASLVLSCSGACASKATPTSATRDGGNSDGATGGATGKGGSGSGGIPVGTGGAGNASGGSAGSSGTSGNGGSGGTPSAADAGPPPPNPCVEAGTCPPGVWTNVTPKGVDLTNVLGCGNYGTETLQADPARPGDFYTLFMCQGIWKSNDYGETWKGPINTGSQGTIAGDCAGGITIPPHDTAPLPTLYAACIRGNGSGFWSSTNGGVDWTRYSVGPGAARQDFYPPVVDPYDPKHLLMAGHEMNLLVESSDGGHSWTEVSTDPGMSENGGTAGIFFVDTGLAATTSKTFLWIAQQSDQYGTWRTVTAGGAWTLVDKNEHPHGLSQIYQPDTGGVVYMAGAYSKLGWGVLRSTDYGATWAHVGSTGGEAMVFGTKKNVYAMASGAVGLGSTLDPSLETAPQPGTGTWTTPGTPKDMTIGAAQAAVTNDGKHDIVVTANWGAGVWRYVEP